MAMKFMKAGATAPASATTAKSQASNAAPPKYLKTGAAAKELFDEAEAQAEIRKSQSGKMYRFFMNEGEERRITFLDGDLDDDGILVPGAAFYEHSVKQNGNWQTFVCTADSDEGIECPICKSGNRNRYIAVFTIIDHTPYKIKKGENAGKIIANTRKLFAATFTTFKQLSKLAGKRGGLAGTTWDVSRVGDKDPRVGGTFDFVEKNEDGSVIMEKYGLAVEELMPADYGDEIVYIEPDKLVELGIGDAVSTHTGVGSEKTLKPSDFKNEL